MYVEQLKFSVCSVLVVINYFGYCKFFSARKNVITKKVI